MNIRFKKSLLSTLLSICALGSNTSYLFAQSALSDTSSIGVSSFASNYNSKSTTAKYNKTNASSTNKIVKSTPKKATITKSVYTEFQKHQFAFDHVKLANSYLKQNNSQKALSEFQKAVSFEPSAYSYYNIGKIYLNQNNLTQAQANLQKAYSMNQNSTSVLTALGETNLKLNNLSQAHSYLCRALKLNPKNSLAQNDLIELWKKKTLQSPNDVENYIGLAKTYQLTGNLKQAQINYQIASKMEPNNPNLLKARDSFKLAVLKYKAKKKLILAHNLSQAGLLNEACAQAQEASVLCPNDTGIQIYQASLAEQAKNYNQAYGLYMQALKNDPSNSYALSRVKELSQMISPNQAQSFGGQSLGANGGNYNYAANSQAPQLPNGSGFVSQIASSVNAISGQNLPVNPMITSQNYNSLTNNTQSLNHVNSLGNFFQALRNEGIAQQLNYQDYEAKVHKTLTGRNSYYTADGQLGDLPVMPGTVKPQIPLPDLEDASPNNSTTNTLDGSVSANSYVGEALADLDYPKTNKLANLANVVGTKIPQMFDPTSEQGREKIKNMALALGDLTINKPQGGNKFSDYAQALTQLTATKKINEYGQVVESPNKLLQAASEFSNGNFTSNNFFNAFKDLSDNAKPINQYMQPEKNSIISPIQTNQNDFINYLNPSNNILDNPNIKTTLANNSINNFATVNNPAVANFIQNNPNILNNPAVANAIQNNPNILNNPAVANFIQNNPNILNNSAVTNFIQNNPNILNNSAIANAIQNNPSVSNGSAVANAIQNNPSVSNGSAVANAIENNPSISNGSAVANAIENNSSVSNNLVSQTSDSLLKLKGPIQKTPQQILYSRVKSDIASSATNNSNELQFMLESIHKTKTGAKLAVVFKNNSSSSLKIPKNSKVLLKIPGLDERHLKVAFLDDVVPAGGEIHGVIKLPGFYCNPKSDLYLENIASSESANGYKNVHLDLSPSVLNSLSTMIAGKSSHESL